MAARPLGGLQAVRHRARRSRTTTPRWRAPSGRTAATCRTRGASCAGACATGARSASPASTTGRSRACTCARPGSTCCRSTRWRALDVDALADVERAAPAARQGAARPRPAAVPDGAPARRARVPSDRRGTRRSTWSPTGSARPTPDRFALYLTARGLTNESYYVAQKVARFLGHPQHRQRRARLPRAVDRRAEAAARRRARRPCSYTDVIGTDLVVLFGSNVANAQPVFMKYLYLARKHGAKVVVVNPLREPGLERYWVPTNVESALFGTKMADEFFPVHTGGDVAFLERCAEGAARRRAQSTTVRARAHDRLRRRRRGGRPRADCDDLERPSGATRDDMERFARLYAAAPAAVLVWSMGITQHEHGADNVAAIVNLALARGNVGRPGAGLMPIRGHSGVQGGAEMGAYATALPGGVPVTADAPRPRWARRTASPSPPRSGWPPTEMVDAAGRGELDVLYSSGGNFLDVLPDPARSRSASHACAAAGAPGHRRVEPDAGRPARHRGAAAGGDALRAARRRHRDHDRAAGRVQPRDRRARGSARRAASGRSSPSSRARVHPDRARPRPLPVGPGASATRSRGSCRRTRASSALHDTGDQVQWGGERLCEGGRVPDRRRAGPLRRSPTPSTRRSPRAASGCPPGAASSSTR